MKFAQRSYEPDVGWLDGSRLWSRCGSIQTNSVVATTGMESSLAEARTLCVAGQMMGNGGDLNPTGASLHAPCDGTWAWFAHSQNGCGPCALQLRRILLQQWNRYGGRSEERVSTARTGRAMVRRGGLCCQFLICNLLARRAKSLLTRHILRHQGFFYFPPHENCSLQVVIF